MIRIAILWSGLPGYMSSALQELNSFNCKLFICTNRPPSITPFNQEIYSWVASGGNEDIFLWNKDDDYLSPLLKSIKRFNPNIILCCGWSNRQYLRVVKELNGTAISIICFDTQWVGNIRQSIGRIWFLLGIKRYFDFAFIPGDRQLNTASKLGFSISKIIFGLYAPDTEIFLENDKPSNIPKKFIFVGRLVHEKGVEILANAYKDYRKKVIAPWPLLVVGAGPLRSLLENIEGVEILGFVQPRQLPPILNQASCMIVPSLVEPWGVQISEGVTAGLAIIATSVCGSSVNLVRPNFNGYVVEPNNSDALTAAMLLIHNEGDLSVFSENSKKLATQFTPKLWATALLRAYSGKFKG